MKSCPVCHAKAFDDAEVCYGCLYRFGDHDSPRGLAAPCGQEAVESCVDRPAPPAFCIKLAPAIDASGGVAWMCSVDVVSD